MNLTIFATMLVPGPASHLLAPPPLLVRVIVGRAPLQPCSTSTAGSLWAQTGVVQAHDAVYSP